MTKSKNISTKFKHNKDLFSVFFIVLLVFLVTLPFINKAFVSDDIYIMTFTRQLIKDPLDPFGFEMDGLSHRMSGLGYGDPPLVIYYAALVSKIFGEKETFLHLFYIIFPLIAGISMYFISKKFSKKPLFCTLLMIATPVFVVSSHSLMQDIPLLAFTLLTLAFYIKGVDTKNNKFLLIASIIAGLAFIVKYNVLLLYAIMILYSLLNRNFKSLRYFLVTIGIISLYFIHNIIYYDTIHVFNTLIPWLLTGKGYTTGFVEWFKIFITLIVGNFSYIGGASIFFAAFFVPFLNKKVNRIVLFISVVLTICLSILLYFVSSTFLSGQYTFLQLVLFSIFVSSSLFLFILFFLEYKKQLIDFIKSLRTKKSIIKFLKNHDNRNILFLFLWLAVVFSFNSSIAGGSVRYNSLLLTPLIILYVNIFLKYVRVNANKILASILILTLIITFSVGYADYLYADSYKKFSNSFDFPEEANTYYLGHEGFKYYMEKKGAIFFLTNKEKIKKGDLIIRTTLPSPGNIDEQTMSRLEYVNTAYINSNYPLRTINADAHAGWYMYGAGFLPYSISRAPIESFDIYVVKE